MFANVCTTNIRFFSIRCTIQVGIFAKMIVFTWSIVIKIGQKIAFRRIVARQTRKRVRSILSVCEELAYRSLTRQMPHKTIL